MKKQQSAKKLQLGKIKLATLQEKTHFIRGGATGLNCPSRVSLCQCGSESCQYPSYCSYC